MPRVRGPTGRHAYASRPGRPLGADRRIRQDRPGDAPGEHVLAGLYAVHYRPLVRAAALLVGDVLAAEEIVQATFVAMCVQARHQDEGCQASAYLWREVVLRARRRQLSRRGRAAAARSSRQPEAALATYAVTALRTLPVRIREAAVLHYGADLPVTEVAAVTGASVRAVQDCLRRAAAALAGHRNGDGAS